MGRKPKLTELQRRVARERVAKGESARSIAQEWGVAHTTVARAVLQEGARPDPGRLRLPLTLDRGSVSD
jgi:transposase